LIATYFTGAQAWLGCRQGELDPARFRMGDENWGIGEVRGSVVLDFAALNKVEMLPWDCWGQMEAAYAGESDIAYDRFLDRVAEIAISDDYTLIADTYEASGDLRVPTQN
jgi:hypothetical protein